MAGVEDDIADNASFSTMHSEISCVSASGGGTYRWMSPELLEDPDGRPTKRSDCYALGMVVYEVREDVILPTSSEV